MLAKRLNGNYDGIFTFVTNPDVDPTNNWAELNIRPAVVMRKNSHGNQSKAGADTQAILMSVFRTLQLRRLDVIEETIRLVQGQIVELHAKRYDSKTAEG